MSEFIVKLTKKDLGMYKMPTSEELTRLAVQLTPKQIEEYRVKLDLSLEATPKEVLEQIIIKELK